MSYDPTRELYADFNKAFAAAYQKETGKSVEIKQSHGGSGKQARAVIDGLQADVVTLALAYDIDAIAEQGPDRQPTGRSVCRRTASPYTSTIVFLVRKGNPKGIKDWDDLVKPGVSVITPNPKTSGGARWNYLAAWGYALKKVGGDDDKAQAILSAISTRTCRCSIPARAARPSPSSSAASATCCWPGRTRPSCAQSEFGKDKFEIVVAVAVDPGRAAGRRRRQGCRQERHPRGCRGLSEISVYQEGQEIAAKNSYRPRDPEIAKEYENSFRQGRIVHRSTTCFGGWTKAQKEHFAEGGIFDQIYKN